MRWPQRPLKYNAKDLMKTDGVGDEQNGLHQGTHRRLT
jgi:hypothetical protein